MSLQLQLQWFHFNSVAPLMCSRGSYEAGGNCIPKENIDHILNFFFRLCGFVFANELAAHSLLS